jgi:probable HAF family extracellular repeat protein
MASILRDGRFTTLDYPGATSTVLYAVNNKNQILGNYTLNSVTTNFVYSNGTFTPLAFPCCGFTAFDLNDRGQIVGYSSSSGLGLLCVLGPPVSCPTEISFPCSQYGSTEPFGINNLGEIVGTYFDNSFNEHQFWYQNGSYLNVDPPNNPGYMMATGINNSGVLIGSSAGRESYLGTPTKKPGSVCGVNDISSSTSVAQGELIPIPPTDQLFSQTDTVTNKASKVIPSAFVVLQGQPTATTALVGNQYKTYCFSATGDYLIPVGTIWPGKTNGAALVWSAPNPFISYTTRVLDGIPDK